MVERRIKTKVEKAFMDFKDILRNRINDDIDTIITSQNIEPELKTRLNAIKKNIIQEMYNHENITLSEEDFKKRKRVKNSITLESRCNALRANKMQCSRRKLGNNCYCGTHLKGQPHGIISNVKERPAPCKNILIWAEEIQGIWYYIDDNKNVYETNDILSNDTNPKIIATYETSICEKTGSTIYKIPDFNI